MEILSLLILILLIIYEYKRRNHVRLLLSIFLAFLIIFSGCILSPEKKEAKFEIVFQEKQMWKDCPAIMFVVKNIGNEIGYDVNVTVSAIKVFKTLDTGSAFLAYSIHPGETAQNDVVFYKLKSHDDYSSITFEISWKKRDE